VLTLLREFAAIGGDVPALLARLGVPFTLADLESGRVALVSDVQFVRLHGECITALSVQANREGGLPPMSKDEVDLLCYCVITCGTLEEVIDRARRFCAMLDHRAADLSLELRGTEAVFHMATRRLRHSVSGLLTDLNGLSFYHRLFSWLIGQRIPVRGYDMYASAPVDAATLEGFYRQSIRFGCDDNCFAFPARVLEKPVVRSYPSLVERLAVFPFDQRAEGAEGGSLAEAVEEILAARLAGGESMPTLEQFASLFNQSRASLGRRLREEGTGLEQIRQRVRLQRAKELLLPAAGLKLEEVARRLGFSDARAFRRAFIAWTGKTPDGWRKSGR
jgi:AraC-like DNA-binding protein